jgi:hypothetical protein
MMAASPSFPTCCPRPSWNSRSTQQRTSQAPALDSCLYLEFVAPLFSYSYELLFVQPLSFDNHPHCPGVSPSNRSDFSPESSLWFSDSVASPFFSFTCALFFSLVALFRAPVLSFQELAHSLKKTRRFFACSANLGALRVSALSLSLFSLPTVPFPSTMLKSIRHRYDHA